MKNLTKKEIIKILDNYNIKSFKSCSKIEKGLSNFNYNLKADKDYIIRFIGDKLTKEKLEQIKLEFEVLIFLKEHTFEYSVPIPLLNKNEKYLSTLNNQKYWVYEKIKGNTIKILNESKLIELAKGLAKYHKLISRFKVDKIKSCYNIEFFKKEFSKLSKTKPKNKVDKLFLDNLEYFRQNLIRFEKYNEGTNILITHSDLTKNNSLFKGNKLVAILDFDLLSIAPRVKDVAYSILQLCFNKNNTLNEDKMKIFLDNYQKINKLSKSETNKIIPLMKLHCCSLYWWFYSQMKKRKELKYVLLEYTIKVNNNLETLLNEDKKSN